MAPTRQRLARLVLVTLALGMDARADGAALTLNTRTVYHAYQLRLFPLTDLAAQRNLNRFYQTLDIGGWSIGDSGDIDAVLSLRYDTDFGTGFRQDTPFGAGIPGVDGRNDLDLMYIYVDWRNVLPRLLDLRFGRQTHIDDLAWYSFDGLKLNSHLWRDGDDGLDVEFYFGMPVRFDALFSSEPFLNDGTQVDDNGFGLVFGGGAALRLFRDLSISAAYRQELQKRAGELENFRFDGSAARSAGKLSLQESRLGASAGYTFRELQTDIYAHFNWDLVQGALEQGRVGAAYNPAPWLHVQAEWLRVRPIFAGDSIFNYFAIFPYDRGRLELDAEILEGLRLSAGYWLQSVKGAPKAERATGEPGDNLGAVYQGSNATHGPSVGVNYRSTRWGTGLSLEAATNSGGRYAYGGNYRMGQLWGDVNFLEGRLSADANLSVTTFQNDWFEAADDGLVDTARTSWMTALGLRGALTENVSARAMFVKNFSSVLEGSYRVYTELAVRY